MKKLSDKQEAERARISAAIDARRQELDDAVTEFNEARDAHWAEVEAALAGLNGAIEEASALKDDVAGDIQAYMDERSEAWQEGERGQQYQSWQEEWEGLDAEEVEMDKPDDLEMPVCLEGETIMNLPASPEEGCP